MSRSIKVTLQLIADGIRGVTPDFLIPKQPYRYAFLVHPRTRRDIERKIPFMKSASPKLMRLFERYFWPGILVPINGLKSHDTGKDVQGYVISIPMTAETMLEDRDAALRQIRKALVLARKRGARIAGLGALTSSLTRGGEALTDIKGIGITTGHAYTGFNVTETAKKILAEINLPIEKTTIGIVGAAGSIGSIAAEIFSTDAVNPAHLILIDIERKQERVQQTATRIQALHPKLQVTVSSDLGLLKAAHVVITATSAPDALIYRKHLEVGTIVVDDAQPSDVSDDVLDADDVLVLSAGAVYTPGISTRFPMGLHGDNVNYCCLAEVLILASEGREENYVISRATIEKVNEIAAEGKRLNFTVAPFQNMRGFVASEHITHVSDLLHKRLGL